MAERRCINCGVQEGTLRSQNPCPAWLGASGEHGFATPEAQEEGGDPWEITEEDIEAAWPPNAVSPWRTALILRDRLRARVEAARTPTVSREQWDALKQAIRTSDTHGRQYAAGLGLTITDHPEADDE